MPGEATGSPSQAATSQVHPGHGRWPPTRPLSPGSRWPACRCWPTLTPLLGSALFVGRFMPLAADPCHIAGVGAGGAAGRPPGLNGLSCCPEGARRQAGGDSFIGRRACWKDWRLFTALRPWLRKETVNINSHDGSVITSLNLWRTHRRPSNNALFPGFAQPWDTLNTLYLWAPSRHCGQENAAFATIV